MGFRLHLRWGLSTHPQIFSFRSSSSWPSSTSLKGRETLYDSVGTSPSFMHWENEASHTDPFRVRTCLSDRQLRENDISVTAEMEIGIGSHSSLYDVIGNNWEVLTEEDKLKFLKSSKGKQFSLLMKNLDLLENIFADSCVVGLERDILAQLERLGALELFNTFLSRGQKSFPFSDLTNTPTELVDETQENDLLNIHTNKIVVTSGKKQERELRRRKRSDTNSDVFTLHLQPKTFKLDSKYPNISSGKTSRNFRNTREKIASSEAEMSKGVKVVAELESIRTILEEETGRVASFSSWAEAAGLSQKVLQQRLHFGWYCRDELLRSTKSLIVYLARNYRGLGVSFEDLVQAGSFGVLQGAVRFDHTRGYQFSTYVQYWIKKSMSMLVALHARGIRVPFTIIKVINKIQKAKKALSSRHGKFPSESEIAKFTGLSTNRILLASKCLRVVGSIDQKLGYFMSAKFVECTADKSVISPEEAVIRQHKINSVYSLLKGLEPKERDILVLRFGLVNNQRKSLEEIGRLHGVSKEWIRRVESRALTKLRNKNSLQDLRYFLHS